MNLQIGEAQQNPNRINTKKIIPRFTLYMY